MDITKAFELWACSNSWNTGTRNTGTPRNTPEHPVTPRNTRNSVKNPEHPGTPRNTF